jgi:hypothetical protein
MKIRRFLANFWVRLFLSVCIIVSLLPFEWVPFFDPIFMVLFGVEFAARVLLVGRGYWDEDDDDRPRQDEERWQWPPAGRLVTLAFDFAALLSFLPASLGAENTRWLRMFRLSRMVLLFSYWAPLVRDVWSVLIRRERARQIVLMGAVVAGLSFSGTVVFENVAENGSPIDFNGDGVVNAADGTFFSHLWWSFRQIQDPGNMVQETHSAVALLVSFALTVAGLMLVSFLIGLGTDVVRELVEISRLRAPGLVGHTVVVNVTPSTRALLFELMGYYRKLLPSGRFSLGWFRQLFVNARARVRGPRYVVVGNPAEPPDFLRHDELSRLVYRQGSHDPGEFARRADVNHAQRVVLLADLESPDPDAETIHSILTLIESMRLEQVQQGKDDGRVRLLIAEVLDESNVAAAKAAISAAGEGTRSFVVPTERLIALFIACVARQPGVGAVLEELLTSRGHEIYTCYFDLSGLGYSHRKAPSLPTGTLKSFEHIREEARAFSQGRHAIPIGLLVNRKGQREEIEVRLNPGPQVAAEEPEVRGFVAVAPNFAEVRDFADRLYERDEYASGGQPLAEDEVPVLVEDDLPPMKRVLIGGFRTATVGLLESLMIGQPELEVLILVSCERERVEAMDAFDAHNRLQQRGLMKGVHAQFPRRSSETLGFVRDWSDDGRTRITVEVGDQSSSRQLMDLPGGFGQLGDMDTVILISREEEGADARTTKTLMKIEALLSATQTAQRVVAEVLDADLARRLRRHYEELSRDDVMVYSIQELRSYFMFQSVVVPSFEMVYEELMGSWGQSFNRLAVAGSRGGSCTFAQLEEHLAGDRGELIIACEFEQDNGEIGLRVGSGGWGGDGVIDLKRLRALWTIAKDGGGLRSLPPPPKVGPKGASSSGKSGPVVRRHPTMGG